MLGTRGYPSAMSEPTPQPAQASAPVSFSTQDLPAAERVELWEWHNDTALIGLRCRTLGGDALEATEVNQRVDRLDLARVVGTSHVVERDLALITERPCDAVALFFSLRGEAFFYHDDGVRTLRPGQLLICDADRPFMRGFSRGLEELVLKIPRPLFVEVTGVADTQRPRVLSFGAGANAVAHTLAKTVGGAARREDPTPTTEESLLALVGALTGHGDRDPADAYRAAAQTYIEQNLHDASLSAETVAAAIGISTRHLSRVFAATGTGFPRHVLRHRLDAAYRLLGKPDATSMTIAEIAHRCGFTSSAHFSSAFATHFGRTASEVRRAAAAQRAIPLAL